jgi:hypothetical protein
MVEPLIATSPGVVLLGAMPVTIAVPAPVPSVGLPLETGARCDEDKERYVEAVAAFERVYRRREGGGR